MSNYEFVAISEPLDVGTRIHYDECTNNAFFVDLPNGTVYRYDVNSGETIKAKVGDEPLSFMFPVAGTNVKFIAGIARKLAFVEWDGLCAQVSKIETIVEVETDPDVNQNRLNGGKVDPWGRLWTGTMGPSDENGQPIPERGALYSLNKGVLNKHICNIGISNGLAWNKDLMKMYYIDSLQPNIVQFDFSEDGRISNQKVVFELGPNGIEGAPDGLTIDTDGNLWFTALFGSAIVKINPNDGKLLEKIDLDVSQPTSISFGGKQFNELFLTSARMPVDGTVPPDPNGTTYNIKNVGCVGMKGNRYKEN